MLILIPTRDRVDAQYTWDNLPKEAQDLTFLVCPSDEVALHSKFGRNVLPRPEGMKLSAVRQWLVEKFSDQPSIIMLDDDLSFFVRKSPDAHNLKPASGPETLEILERLTKLIESSECIHAGLSPRQGNNWLFPDRYISGSRMNAVHAINPAKLIESGVRYDDVDMMEDYHVVLSLFEQGQGNIVITDAAWDQNKGSGAPGGFSHYRNPETQKKASERLAALHPRYVKVVTKAPKTGSGGFAGERVDVRVQWVKALKEGKKD